MEWVVEDLLVVDEDDEESAGVGSIRSVSVGPPVSVCDGGN